MISFNIFKFCFLIYILHPIDCNSVDKLIVPTESNPKNESQLEGICRTKNCRNLCNTPKVDSVLNYRNGSLFVFKGNFFWSITEPKTSPNESNRRIIKDYWNPNGRAIFTGPIDAIFNDDLGYTHFFKGNVIYIFKGQRFEGSQRIDGLEYIDSALLVRNIRLKGHSERTTALYLFKGQYFWTMLNMHKVKYDWNQMFSLFNKHHIKEIHPKFPAFINAAYQNDRDNIIFIKGEKYIEISIERIGLFLTPIEDKDLNQRFIYKDLLNCDPNFYQTTRFHNYDQFIIELISNKSPINTPNNYDYRSAEECPTLEDKSADSGHKSREGQTCNQWVYLLFGTGVGTVVTLAIVCLTKYVRSNRESELYTYSKGRGFRGINLIQQNELSPVEL